jgi:hypothetical protein
MMDQVIKVLKALTGDGGTVLFTFNNGASDVYIDVVDPHECRIGRKSADHEACLAHLEANKNSVEEIV